MNKKKVAFICVHNSCRSQIAEALGKYILFASEQEYFEFMHYRGYIYVILELVLKDLVRT